MPHTKHSETVIVQRCGDTFCCHIREPAAAAHLCAELVFPIDLPCFIEIPRLLNKSSAFLYSVETLFHFIF